MKVQHFLLLSIFFILLLSATACKNNTSEPCTVSITKWVKPDGTIEYIKGDCTGECPDKTQCKWHKTTNHHGGTREWCGCGEREATDECYPVLITPGEGEGGGAPSVICPPRNCPEGTICTLVEDQIRQNEEGTYYSLRCECVDQPPQDDKK